jgi:predicted metal-dependent HD superfamily phosphohydrolase
LTVASLAPLALDKELLRQQSEALRLEFAGVPEDEFNESRKQFLRSMIDREQIFLTGQLHEELENKARENIKQSLAALS